MVTRYGSLPRVIFIVGPTAVGKTRLARRLSKELGAEVVSCDSMQVYKGMPIMNQAPPKGRMARAACHLTEFLSPEREFSVAGYRRLALRAIRGIVKRGNIPLVVGGSGLYVKALVDGLFPSPEADTAFRSRMQHLASRQGKRSLHRRLARIDPDAAAKIHPNDLRRTVRALEVYRTTGKTMTELKIGTRALAGEYAVKIFGLTGPRGSLYAAIDRRVERMVRDGLVEEVKRLLRKRVSKTARAALGFKEIAAYLKGEIGFDEAIGLLKRNTRRFAKRQIAWFKADKRIRWFDVSRMSETRIIQNIYKTLCQRKTQSSKVKTTVQNKKL